MITPLEQIARQQDALNASNDSLQSRMWTALPGEVVSYDPSALTVQVQPTVKGLVTQQDGSGETVDMPVLPDVPVCFPHGGGLSFTFPINPGDECLVVFSSRCIDGWWQSGGSQVSPEFRMHDLSDGFAIIGPWSQKNKISNPSTEAAQLRTDDGSAYIEMHPNGVVNGKGPIFNWDGDFHVTGTLTADVDVEADGVSLRSHVHTGVEPGGGTSGPPEA